MRRYAWVVFGAGLALSMGVAGCAFQGDSESSTDENVVQADDALTSIGDNGPDPGQDVESGEGHEPSPEPWRGTATMLTGPGTPDPDPSTLSTVTTTTTTTTTSTSGK